MNTSKFKVASLAALLFVASVHCSKSNIVGFVNYQFQAGANLFGNPLLSTNDTVSTLFQTAPVGTTISLWDPITLQYSQSSTYNGSAWSVNLTLNPGTGALLTTPSSFLNTFVGSVPDASGGVYDGTNLNPPSPFGGPSGLYLWSSKFPASLPLNTGTEIVPTNTLYDAFTLLVGRSPQEGEAVWRYNRNTVQFEVTTFLSGSWDNGDPGLNLGESAFFNIGPVAGVPIVPEPSAVALLTLSALVVSAFRRQQPLRG